MPRAGSLLRGRKEWSCHGDGTRSCSGGHRPRPGAGPSGIVTASYAQRYFTKPSRIWFCLFLRAGVGRPGSLLRIYFFFLTDKETEPGGGRLINFHNVASESGRKGDGPIFLLSQPRANPGAAGSAPAEPPGNALPRACLTPGSPAPRRGAPCSGWPGVGGPSLWPRCWCLYTQLGSGTGPSHPPWEQSHGSPQGRHSTCRGSDGS